MHFFHLAYLELLMVNQKQYHSFRGFFSKISLCLLDYYLKYSTYHELLNKMSFCVLNCK